VYGPCNELTCLGSRGMSESESGTRMASSSPFRNRVRIFELGTLEPCRKVSIAILPLQGSIAIHLGTSPRVFLSHPQCSVHAACVLTMILVQVFQIRPPGYTSAHRINDLLLHDSLGTDVFVFLDLLPYTSFVEVMLATESQVKFSCS